MCAESSSFDVCVKFARFFFSFMTTRGTLSGGGGGSALGVDSRAAGVTSKLTGASLLCSGTACPPSFVLCTPFSAMADDVMMRCVSGSTSRPRSTTHTHTHTHPYMCIVWHSFFFSAHIFPLKISLKGLGRAPRFCWFTGAWVYTRDCALTSTEALCTKKGVGVVHWAPYRGWGLLVWVHLERLHTTCATDWCLLPTRRRLSPSLFTAHGEGLRLSRR